MNTQTTIPPETPVATARTSGPGSQLRQARLDLKLTPENVAHILHLSPRQIVALENDDYEHLAGPTYVRGYLRGYAQLLGLSAEPVIEAYSRSVTANKPVDLGKLVPKPEIRSDHQLIKFATIGVAVIVLGLSALWWQERDRPGAPVSLPQTPTNIKSGAPTETDDTTESSAITTDNKEATPSETVRPQAAKPALTAPERAPAAREKVAPPSPPVATPPPVTGPRARLLIQAPLDCWADVRDADGNRLLYETILAGQTAVIEGVAPLSVFLGNVEGVRVELNGQPFDISPYRRGDVARFTLGESR